MTQEAKVRVRLDTTQAKQELEQLIKMAERISPRAPGGGPGPGSGGGGSGFNLATAFGLGAAISTGAALIGSVSQSALGDITGEFFGGVGARVSDAIFGTKDDEARARRQAREETIQVFGSQAATNKEAALNYFNQIAALRYQSERGASAVREDLRFYTKDGTDFAARNNNLVDFVVKKVGEFLGSGFDKVVDAVKSIGS